MKPLADNIKIKLDSDKMGYGGKEKDKEASGIVVSVPEVMHYFGMHSFVFESSLANKDVLKELQEYYSSLVGKRVFWSAGKQLGSVLEEQGQTFAFLKMTDLICVGEADADAQNITSTAGGSFNL